VRGEDAGAFLDDVKQRVDELAGGRLAADLERFVGMVLREVTP